MSEFLLLIGLSFGLFAVPSMFGDDADPEDDAVEASPVGPDDNTIIDVEFQEALASALTDEQLANIDFVDGPLDVDTGDGNDFVGGGSGDDQLVLGAGDDIASSGAGNDTVDLGPGDDQYDSALVAAAVDPVFTNSDLGDDTIDGGAGNDRITDSFGSNILSGGDGNDILQAVDSEEEAGVTADELDGGAGDDVFLVDQGDTVITGSGNDQVQVLVGDGAGNIAGSEAVVIEDFDLASDALQLGGMFETADLSIEIFDDGTGSTVLWNNTPIVRVVGGQDLTLADILIAA